MPSANYATRCADKPSGFQSIRRPRRAERREQICVAALGILALATLGSAIACVISPVDRSGSGIASMSAIVLLASTLIQARIALAVWRCRATVACSLLGFRFWEATALGALLAYACGLLNGPAPGVAWAWWAGVSAWYTAQLYLTASPSVAEAWRQWSQRRTWRRTTWIVYTSTLLVVGSEVGLRAHRAIEHYWLPGDRDATLASDEELAVVAAGAAAPFRVAVIGETRSIDKAYSDGYLARIRDRLSGVDIVALGVERPWTNNGAAWSQRLQQQRIDLALAVIDVCDDLAGEPLQGDWFDWRQLELASRIVGQAGSAERASKDRAGIAAAATDYESFLRQIGPQLSACQTPINDVMQSRWQQTFSAFAALESACQRRGVPVALILVPGQFQVNRPLCETLVRRLGYTSEQLDVELPQRRWTGFAEARSVPTLDLLPHLRVCRQAPFARNAANFSDSGHAATAEAVGNWLQSQYGSHEKLAVSLTAAP